MTAWGTSAGDWPNLVQIVAIPPRPERRGLGKMLFVAWLLDLFSGEGWGWFGGASGSGPTRVVVRYGGKEHSLFKEDSFESAKQNCERIAREYDAMDPPEWCRRYRVPDSFFSS